MAVDVSRINNIPLFADLSDEELLAVAAKLEERVVDAGRHLATEHGAGYFFFVMESGTADVLHDEVVIAQFGPGDFFGEAAIFRTFRRTATVTATSESTVFAMFGADFALLVGQIPVLKDRIDAAMAERLPPSPSR
jgi:CRP-like cAMP-binding protein